MPFALRKYRKQALRLAFVFALSVICLLMAAPLSERVSAEGYVLFVQGGALYSPDAYPPSLILGTLPVLVLCYLFADFLAEDIDRAATYVFTRTRRRSQWLARKIGLLCLGVLVFYALLLLALIGVFMFVNGGDGSPGQLSRVFLLFAPLVALNTLSSCAALIAIDLLAMRIGSLRSFLVIVFVRLLSIFACIPLTGEARAIAVRILPAAQGVFAWHDVSAFQGTHVAAVLAGASVPGFSLAYSYGYLVVLIALEAAIGLWMMQRADLLRS